MKLFFADLACLGPGDDEPIFDPEDPIDDGEDDGLPDTDNSDD